MESKAYYNEKKGKYTVAWQRINDGVPVYLMKFVNDGVGYRSGRQYAYRLMEKRAYGLPYTDGKRKLLTCTLHHKGDIKEYTIDICNIKIHCFGTGVGFLVYDVWYSADMGCDDILEFSYLFKKVGIGSVEIPRRNIRDSSEKSIYLQELSRRLITNELDDAEMFFYVNNVVKMESNVFTVFCDKDRKAIDDKLFHFSHAYNSDYEYNQSYHDENFCCYHPYPYIHWGYCQNGIACVYYDVNNFTSNNLNENIQNEYYFMYLVLLNQRYTILALISEMMSSRREIPGEWREIQKKLIEYQIEYSFHIVSDEMVYHRIYMDLRRILSIDELENELKDISDRMYMMKNEELRENEERLRNQEEKRKEKEEILANNRNWRTNIVLGMLSLLTVFSAFSSSTALFNQWCSTGEEKFHLLLPHVIAYGLIVWVAFVVIRVLWDSYRQYRKSKGRGEIRGEDR